MGRRDEINGRLSQFCEHAQKSYPMMRSSFICGGDYVEKWQDGKVIWIGIIPVTEVSKEPKIYV